MFDSLCTYPLQTDLFSLATHPSEPLLAVGLSSGHVQLNRVPEAKPSSTAGSTFNTIAIQWRTRRHKGSCRSLCFDPNGDNLWSTGTDGIVKLAATETGVVKGKIAVPLDRYVTTCLGCDSSCEVVRLTCGSLTREQNPDLPTIIHALNSQTLLLGTDSSALHLFDIRLPSKSSPEPHSLLSKPVQTHHPHADYVTSISSLPSKSSSGEITQWLSTGGTTVAVTDIRRGILVQSEDQGEELFSSTILMDQKALVAGEKGIVRIWKVGVWDDNETTFNASLGAKAGVQVMSCVPNNDVVAVGRDDGTVGFVNVSGKRPRLIDTAEVSHDEIEGVAALGFLAGGRMASGGGAIVKIWEERREVDEDSDSDESDIAPRNGKNVQHNLQDSDTDSDEDDTEDSKPQRKKKKKKKRRRKGNGTSGGAASNVVGFKDLD